MTRAARTHREEVEKMTITGADALIERGRQEGLREALLRVLASRFGALPQHVPVRFEAMSLEAPTTMFDRALVAQSLAELDLGA